MDRARRWRAVLKGRGDRCGGGRGRDKVVGAGSEGGEVVSPAWSLVRMAGGRFDSAGEVTTMTGGR